MKKRNSTSEFGKERNLFLLQAFRESIAAQSKIAIKNAFKEATEAPPPRFWVSEARAAAVIAELTFRVVNEEAPRSYISWQRARMIIYEEKRLLKKERRGGS